MWKIVLYKIVFEKIILVSTVLIKLHCCEVIDIEKLLHWYKNCDRDHCSCIVWTVIEILEIFHKKCLNGQTNSIDFELVLYCIC